jgi:uncharacterized membrane protein (UPF0127 family)
MFQFTRLSIFSRFLPLVLLFGACTGGNTSAPSKKGRTLSVEARLAVVSPAGDTLAILPVALADSDEERTAGLMDVFTLAPAEGMLFIFEEETPQTFWMANTPLSLDMIFINASGEIVSIYEATRPYSNSTYSSGRPANRVLEVPAGWCADRDVREGAKVLLLN